MQAAQPITRQSKRRCLPHRGPAHPGKFYDVFFMISCGFTMLLKMLFWKKQLFHLVICLHISLLLCYGFSTFFFQLCLEKVRKVIGSQRFVHLRKVCRSKGAVNSRLKPPRPQVNQGQLKEDVLIDLAAGNSTQIDSQKKIRFKNKHANMMKTINSSRWCRRFCFLKADWPLAGGSLWLMFFLENSILYTQNITKQRVGKSLSSKKSM